MGWNVINSQVDIDNLMECFGGFHDSCLKEIWFTTGTYVNEDLSMSMINEPSARAIFQRQGKAPSVIEIEFNNIVKINIKPVYEGYSTDIFSAIINKVDDTYYWADWDGWSLQKSNGENECTWIASKQIKWRERDNLLGGKKIYCEI